jgi:WD40 repeat protein
MAVTSIPFNQIAQIAWSYDKKYLYTIHKSGIISQWNCHEETYEIIYETSPFSTEPIIVPCNGRNDIKSHLLAYTINDNKDVCIYDSDMGKTYKTIKGRNIIISMNWLRDGKGVSLYYGGAGAMINV